MLNLTKISAQMQGFSEHLTSEVAAGHQRLELAQQFFKKAVECQEELVKSQEEWQNRIIFANATPIEPLETCITISVPPQSSYCHFYRWFANCP